MESKFTATSVYDLLYDTAEDYALSASGTGIFRVVKTSAAFALEARRRSLRHDCLEVALVEFSLSAASSDSSEATWSGIYLLASPFAALIASSAALIAVSAGPLSPAPQPLSSAPIRTIKTQLLISRHKTDFSPCYLAKLQDLRFQPSETTSQTFFSGRFVVCKHSCKDLLTLSGTVRARRAAPNRPTRISLTPRRGVGGC